MDDPQGSSNKVMIFRAKVTPRLLPTKDNNSIRLADLKEYNKHLYRVFTANPVVDNSAPFMNPYTYVNLSKIRTDAMRLETIDQENRFMISRINAINRSRPYVDCWNVYNRGKPGLAALQYVNYAKRVMADNRTILSSIKKAKSLYSKKALMKDYNLLDIEFNHKIKLTKVFHIRKYIDQKLSEQPSLTTGIDIQFPIPRKKAFLDFSFKSGVHLGKIIVELYSDFAPKLTRNFLAHCIDTSEFSYKNCRIHYGEKGKFFASGDVTLGNGKGGHSIYKKKLVIKPNQLKHTRFGILLAVPINEPVKFNSKQSIGQRIRKKPLKPSFNSQFAITLSSNNCYDERAIIFGKIIKGNAVLVKINDMLRRCGTPLETIIITDCGVKPYTKKELKQLDIAKINMALAGIPFDDGSEDEDEEVEDI